MDDFIVITGKPCGSVFKDMVNARQHHSCDSDDGLLLSTAFCDAFIFYCIIRILFIFDRCIGALDEQRFQVFAAFAYPEHGLDDLQVKIEQGDKRMLANIKLLQELSYGLRNGILRIVKQSEE